MDPEDGARAQDDRAFRGSPGARGCDLVRPLVVRLRHPRRQRVQGLHEHQQHRRRSEELRRAVVRGCPGRHLHHPAQFVRAGEDGRILPHPARRADGVRGEVDLCALRVDRQRHAVRVRMGRVRDARDLEYDAAPGARLRQRRHCPGAVLPERRVVRGLVRRQEGELSEAAGADAAEAVTQRTEPARGMRDFLPEDVRRREYVIAKIKSVYERYGFEPLETPAVENIETLLGKYGEEGNQLIFKILRRGEHEATGQADLALRYDLTVPLARVVAQYQNELPKFFKRYQLEPVWRADRPAKGRFREFCQCDIDSLGSTSPIIEAELLSAVCEVLERLGFRDFVVRLNHRGLLTALLDTAGVAPDEHADALVALDKLDKIGREGVEREFAARGIPESATTKALAFFGGEPAASDATLARLAGIVGQHDAIDNL